MQKILLITIALLGLVTAAFISITGIDGNWTGILTGPEDFRTTINFNLKNVNGTLTGSSQTPNNAVYDISDGKVKGDSLSFSIVVDNGDKIINNGKYYPAGDSISLTSAFMGATMHATLTRVTDK
jgi:hypothetical protein